jgi:protoheme IX farnesyltransferase
VPEGIKKYFLVTKPGIIFGNLVSVAGGFFLASQGRVDISVLLPTLVGMSLVIASGCVLNNCVDRTIDRKMARTQNRVLARGLMSPGSAVCYASLLGIAGTAMLWRAANLLSVAIVLTGFTVYVGVYSLYLKRHSVYATLIGSLAGAAPPLAGYCAVTNRFDMGALILLLIFSLWQIPHSYAIAILRFKDYAVAAIPVLPVKLGTPAGKKHIVGYMLAFTAATLLLTFGGYTGYRYLSVAAAMGLSWLYMAWSGYRTSDDRIWAKKIFIFSILTMTILSVMMSIDFKIPAGALPKTAEPVSVGYHWSEARLLSTRSAMKSQTAVFLKSDH